MVISPVSQLPSQPCLVVEKPAALKIWLASLVGTLGLVSANVVVLRKARGRKCEDDSFHFCPLFF